MKSRSARRSKPARPGSNPPRPKKRRGLGLAGIPRSSLQTRLWRYTMAMAALVLLVGWMSWYAVTPPKLPVSSKVATATTVVSKPIYIGMFTVPSDFGRTLRIAGVKSHATANEKLEVTPVLCRRGTVGVTTEPGQFCSDMVNPEGARLVGGDSIMLKVQSDMPAVAIIDRIRIAYREDLRWDTQPAGNKQAIVTVAGRSES